jgi:hypothetical protein
MAEPDDPFLTRWSRRKRTANDDGETPDGAAAEDAAPEEDAALGAAAHPDEAEIVAQLPDIDSLEESSDFTVFLKEGVPEALRRKALRKLWRLNPVFANLDGLNDYDEDYTLATSALTAVKTIYKVGKGMISEEDEEPKPSAAPETPDEPTPVADSEEPPADEESEDESPNLAEADRDTADQDTLESPTDAESVVVDRPDPPSAPSGRSAAERRWGAFRRG